MVGLFDGGIDGLMEQIVDCGFRIADLKTRSQESGEKR
jgi:hypothetical protein